MTVTNVHKDTDALTLTIVSAFAAPIEQVWQLWADPRKLERWWGPPTFPATFSDHDLSPGGSVSYYMTGPDGEQPHGWWRVLEIDAPHSLRFEDGFADESGAPLTDMPTNIIRVTLAPTADGGTEMSVETTFSSVETMEQMAAMGMIEGMTMALEQIDELLAA